MVAAGSARRAADRHPRAIRAAVARARHRRGGARQQGRARGAGAVGGGRAPAARPGRLPDPGGRPGPRPGHHPDRGGRRHARPAGRRAGRGGGRPVVPAPADAAPPPLRRHHRRQPREHALDGRLPHPGRRLVRRRPAGREGACGRRASTRSRWRTTTPATTARPRWCRPSTGSPTPACARSARAATWPTPAGPRSSSGTASASASWGSTPSARPRRPVLASRVRARSACRSARGRSTGPSSTACSRTCDDSPAAWTW